MTGPIPLVLGAALVALAAGPGAAEPSLAERLGYRAADRLLIVNGDDCGMCHTANQATLDCLENGLMTSATIMVPCPWFPEIARYARAHPALDFGVHLTHTSEWQGYRWGPVASRATVPSLVDSDGYLWGDTPDVFAHATTADAETEARAQIEMAKKAGVDITHLDSHMGALQLDPRFYEVYVKLAREYDLPLRMGSQATLAKYGYPGMRDEAARQGIVFPDYLIHEEEPAPGESRKAFWTRILRSLKPGVTELYIHAGMRTDELKAVCGSWEERSADHDLFTTDADIRRTMEDAHITRIGYRALRDLQRQRKPSPAR